MSSVLLFFLRTFYADQTGFFAEYFDYGKLKEPEIELIEDMGSNCFNLRLVWMFK